MTDIVEMTRLCSVCFKMCRDMCPVASATRRESDSPHNRAFFVQRIMQELKALDGEAADYFYRCALCKACREACETGQDAGEVQFSARKEIKEALLPPRLVEARERIFSRRPYGEEPIAVKKLLAGAGNEAGGAALVLFGAKMRAGGAGDGSSLAALLSLLKKLGAAFAVLDDEPVTGHIPYFLGFTDIARKRAGEFMEALRKGGRKKIVLASADELRMAKVEYPKMGIDAGGVEFVSLPEFLLEAAKTAKLRFRNAGRLTVAYHDPCGLGRELRLFEQPRELLRMVPGLKLVEPAYTRDQAPCCGYGVGLVFTHPEISEMMAKRLIAVAESTGADTLVTGCPTCRDVIAEYAGKNLTKKNAVEVLDLALLLDRMTE